MSSHKTTPRRAVRGVTLIEVLLVLCLLVMLAGMSWPLMSRAFDAQRLRTAADQVRTAWVRARTNAIDTGCVHVFRYTTEGGRFQVERRSEGDPAAAAIQDELAGLSEGAAPPTAKSVAERLPEGISFAAAELAADPRATAAPAASQGELKEGETGWSDPVSFYPDGTTTTALVRLKNQHGRCIEVRLRGVTGVVTIGEVMAEEDVPL